MTHVLIISHDVIGARMAGPGIRYWEMARVLAAQQPVSLVSPGLIDVHLPGVHCGSYTPGDAASLAPWCAAADMVIANGPLLYVHPELADIEQPLVLDLYDPVVLENLELFRTIEPAQRQAQFEQDRAMLMQQLAAGDFLLCATERQRDLYLGALLMQGRITPAYADSDPQLRGLIDVAGFGLPAEPPVKQHPALRGVVPGIGADDIVLLWTGGLWDWLDPLTLIHAMPRVVEQVPHVRLVFLAGKHPGTIQPMRMPDEARALADALGLRGTHIFFYEQWVPYDERADFLLEADIAVSLHRNHLETAYAAVRSRFLDHLWAGLPSIVSTGDAAADLVRMHNLGYNVAPEDVDATADALCHLARNAQVRQQCAAQARQIAQFWTWECTLGPLARFCRAPRRSPHRRSSQKAEPAPASQEAQHNPPAQPERREDGAMTNRTRDEMLSKLDQLWKVQPQPLSSGVPGVGRAKELANSLTRWYVQSIVDQQNTFHAAVVHTFQAFATEMDQANQRHSEIERRHAEMDRRHIELVQHVNHHVAAHMRRFERDELLMGQIREQTHINQEQIGSNLGLIHRMRHDIEQNLHDQQQTILATQQSLSDTQQNLRDQQQTILETQRMADRLRQRIEEDERRIERNKNLLEQLIQHIHDLDEVSTALAARLAAAPANGEPSQ
jgi:glycosyltransferase involved in cell wall biosynthesis